MPAGVLRRVLKPSIIGFAFSLINFLPLQQRTAPFSPLESSLSLASKGGRITYHHGRNHWNNKHCGSTIRRLLLRTIATPFRPHTTITCPILTRRPYSPPLNCLLTRRAMLAVRLPRPTTTPLTSMHSLPILCRWSIRPKA